MKERKERSSSRSPSLISPSEKKNFPREIFFSSPDPLSVTPKNHTYKKNNLSQETITPFLHNQPELQEVQTPEDFGFILVRSKKRERRRIKNLGKCPAQSPSAQLPNANLTTLTSSYLQEYDSMVKTSYGSSQPMHHGKTWKKHLKSSHRRSQEFMIPPLPSHPTWKEWQTTPKKPNTRKNTSTNFQVHPKSLDGGYRTIRKTPPSQTQLVNGWRRVITSPKAHTSPMDGTYQPFTLCTPTSVGPQLTSSSAQTERYTQNVLLSGSNSNNLQNPCSHRGNPPTSEHSREKKSLSPNACGITNTTMSTSTNNPDSGKDSSMTPHSRHGGDYHRLQEISDAKPNNNARGKDTSRGNSNQKGREKLKIKKQEKTKEKKRATLNEEERRQRDETHPTEMDAHLKGVGVSDCPPLPDTLPRANALRNIHYFSKVIPPLVF
jgi:hypothetical protein